MIPLLEWADAKGITERVGDARQAPKRLTLRRFERAIFTQ